MVTQKLCGAILTALLISGCGSDLAPQAPATLCPSEAERKVVAAIQELKGLTNGQELNLRHLSITDASLVHLKGLTDLRALNLPNGIGDAGLAHLKGLTNLQDLDLRRMTRVTDVHAANSATSKSAETRDSPTLISALAESVSASYCSRCFL